MYPIQIQEKLENEHILIHSSNTVVNQIWRYWFQMNYNSLSLQKHRHSQQQQQQQKFPLSSSSLFIKFQQSIRQNKKEVSIYVLSWSSLVNRAGLWFWSVGRSFILGNACILSFCLEIQYIMELLFNPKETILVKITIVGDKWIAFRHLSNGLWGAMNWCGTKRGSTRKEVFWGCKK